MSSTLIVQLDMRTLCQEADIAAEYVVEIVEHGIVEPSGERRRSGCSTIRRRCWPSVR